MRAAWESCFSAAPTSIVRPGDFAVKHVLETLQPLETDQCRGAKVRLPVFPEFHGKRMSFSTGRAVGNRAMRGCRWN
jgi:hypothetical protein